uniref:Chromogranin-A n=1 Tax=Sphenodon punctatus TaxID=8508 RepID=A0A8D0L1A3_SPHPU
LPVTNPTNKSDSKVMKCIVEVISDTLSKPNPLPISRECLETLKGDERIVSVLRHQNLLKELQEIAAKGASERTEQQEKNGGFEDELSEVLEKQNDRSLEAGKGQQNKRDDSMKEEKNSLEAREPRIRNVDPEDNKENAEEFESNEIGETEEVHREDTLNNHISDDLTEDQESEQRHQEGEEDPTNESLELEEEKEHVSEKSQEESKEEVEETVQDRAEEEEEKEENGRGTSEEERPTSSIEDETEETQREDKGRHRSEDDVMQEEDTSHPRESKSEEMEEEPSKEWEDSKRWNKMDELAKQLTTKKRAEENDNAEDPDRSMKMSFRSHKYDFHNPEETVRSSWKRHSKEDSSEGAFPLVAVPEEKKDEEGSANRRTEDQELESLAAIEAELEKVAHKLHELRKG